MFFDGNHKPKRQHRAPQPVTGPSVDQLRLERQRREAEAKKLRAVVAIQSCYRSFAKRLHAKEEMILQWSCPSTFKATDLMQSLREYLFVSDRKASLPLMEKLAQTFTSFILEDSFRAQFRSFLCDDPHGAILGSQLQRFCIKITVMLENQFALPFLQIFICTQGFLTDEARNLLLEELIAHGLYREIMNFLPNASQHDVMLIASMLPHIFHVNSSSAHERFFLDCVCHEKFSLLGANFGSELSFYSFQDLILSLLESLGGWHAALKQLQRDAHELVLQNVLLLSHSSSSLPRTVPFFMFVNILLREFSASSSLSLEGGKELVFGRKENESDQMEDRSPLFILHRAVCASLCLGAFSEKSDQEQFLRSITWQPCFLIDLWRMIGGEVRAVLSKHIGGILFSAASLDLFRAFALFVECFNRILMVAENSEFIEANEAWFNVVDVQDIAILSRDTVLKLFLYPAPSELTSLRDGLVPLLAQIYSRRICSMDVWSTPSVSILSTLLGNLTPELFEAEDKDSISLSSPSLSSQGPPDLMVTAITVLKRLPFLFPFLFRVGIFRRFVIQDRGDDVPIFGPRPTIEVTRGSLFSDAFTQLYPLGAVLKARIAVQMINEQGLSEAGIDGGGIFREFLEHTLIEGFGPEVGLFCENAERALYPDPAKTDSLSLQRYVFLGRLVGRALLDSQLVDIPLTRAFLTLVLSKWSFFNDMELFDPEYYKQLCALKLMNVTEELALDFTTTGPKGDPIELVPGGKHTSVTNANKLTYMYKVADYKLNRQFLKQASAFRAGLLEVVPPSWLMIFNEAELQMLIGGEDKILDVADLQANTVYGGEYHAEHITVRYFWDVLKEFSDEERRNLLKFVTGCSRPPLNGFAYLKPLFCIHSAGYEDRLPTSATCMNLLKLPVILDKDALRTKLLYALHSNSGFELS